MPSVASPVATSLDIDALIADAGAALVRGDVAAARSVCGTIRDQLRFAGEPVHVAGAVARLEARASLAAGDTDAALDALDAALAIATAGRDGIGAAHTLNHIANVEFGRGRLDDAQRNFEAARARARQVGDRRLAAVTTVNLGAIANIRGDVKGAISAYRRAITDLRVAGPERDLAAALNNLGMAKADLGQWDGAQRAYAEALAIAVRAGDSESQARLHVNLAEAWIGRGDLARAHAACTDAMAAARSSAHTHAVGEVHRLFGIIARESGALDEADAEFRNSERVANAREDLLLLAETAREQADLFRRQSRNRETLQALNRAHRLFAQLRAQRDLADVGRKMSRLEGDFVGVARRWGESIEAADRYTQGHCQRVADLACLIAAEVGFDAQALFWFRIGALLHDVGKLVVPAEILNKPGKLTDAEFALMRSHTTEGVRMLADVEFPWDVRPILESHHERWDGRGYPHGLAGDAIPLTARILCVADVYDALTSVRSYKRALSHDEAMAILRKDNGQAFDPGVFASFEAVAAAWAAQQASATATTVELAVVDVWADRQARGLDPLTGLPTRSAFFRECERVLAARAEDGRPTGLVVVRAIDTPSVIAHRGRSAFDAALTAVAEALSRHTRGGDFVGRYSDDEFVILLPDEDLLETHAAATRLRECAEAARVVAPSHGATSTFSLRVQVGVAAAPQHGHTADSLLAAADATLGRCAGGRAAA
ncbi:MAG TPA: HD domain-containing phosphohydrolase [Gemmatirosa sp.]